MRWAGPELAERKGASLELAGRVIRAGPAAPLTHRSQDGGLERKGQSRGWSKGQERKGQWTPEPKMHNPI